jgi:hypothetical protein
VDDLDGSDDLDVARDVATQSRIFAALVRAERGEVVRRGWHAVGRAGATGSGDDDAMDRPSIGAPLPGADAARIDRAKLVGYALDPESPDGRHKAAVFRRALAIELGDWEYLRDRIVGELPRHPVTRVRAPRHERDAYTWEVLVPIRGLRERSERRLMVITAWQIVAGRPVLTTLRVAPQSRQE